MNSVAIDPNRPIEWSHWYKLAKDLDDTAANLGVSTWRKLTKDDDTPFPQKSTYGVSQGLPDELFIHFQLTPGTSQVLDQYLAVRPEQPWQAPDASLKNLLVRKDLFLVTKADICWCNSILQLLPRTGSSAYVSDWEINGAQSSQTQRCCWSLRIPQVGESLDDNQSVIPVGYLQKWGGAPIRLKNNGEDMLWMVRPACADKNGSSVGEIWLRFKRQKDGKYQLVAVARLLTPDYLTWPIKKQWMEKFKEYINRLPPMTSGVRLGSVSRASPTNMQGPNIPANSASRVVDQPRCLEKTSPFMGPIFTCKQSDGFLKDVLGLGVTDFQPLGTHRDSLFANDKSQIPPGCSATFREFQQLLNCVDVHNYTAFAAPEDEAPDKPGCLTKVGIDPWDDDACGTEVCTAGYQKVYAHTYNQLRKIIILLGQRLVPYSASTVFPNCCFDGVPNALGKQSSSMDESAVIRAGPSEVWKVIPSRRVGAACSAVTNGVRLVGFVVGGCSVPQLPFYFCRDDGDPKSGSDYAVRVEGSLSVSGAGSDDATFGGSFEETKAAERSLVVGPFDPGPDITISVTCSERGSTQICDRCDYDSEDPEVAEAAGACRTEISGRLTMVAAFTVKVFLVPAGFDNNRMIKCMKGQEVENV